MTLSRRTALKLGLAGVLAPQAASAQSLSDTKVIVVGAGIAGLAAAQTLRQHGAEVVIREASNRMGGRIRTDWSLGAPFEYGAGWIHGPSGGNPVQKLAQGLGIKGFVTEDDNIEMFERDGTPMAAPDYERLEAMEHQILALLARTQDLPRTLSLHDLLAQELPQVLNDPWGRWVLATLTEFDIGASLGQISASLANRDEAFPGKDVIVPEGFETLLEPLTEGLDIRLNSPVAQISYDEEDGVVVDGTWADFAICTVPLGVLKAGQIAFDPPLPRHMQSAIRDIGFGSVTKVAMQFDAAFWDVETQYFGMPTTPSGRWGYWLNYRTFSDENILLGLSFGDYALTADQMDNAALTDDALAVLRGAWGPQVPAPTRVLRTAWSQDPLFHGAYSFAQVGSTLDQFEAFETPVADRLFWAGEHTIFERHGMSHGALMSGQRAAQAILEW